ncbi:hypothetical protein B0J17DRAFT_93988 [Rhizoctonia solani]|nr:hypothetical protein B0J17DRAFT_93988 [Rhizoctonia solani]
MDSAPPTEVHTLSRFGACLVCRRRKLRCDATQPECGRCRSTNSTCQYQDPAYRSRTRVLQDHIKELEAKIEEIKHQRRRPSESFCASGSSSHRESTLNSDALSLQSAPQATSLVSIPNGSAHQATSLSSHLLLPR